MNSTTGRWGARHRPGCLLRQPSPWAFTVWSRWRGYGCSTLVDGHGRYPEDIHRMSFRSTLLMLELLVRWRLLCNIHRRRFSARHAAPWETPQRTNEAARAQCSRSLSWRILAVRRRGTCISLWSLWSRCARHLRGQLLCNLEWWRFCGRHNAPADTPSRPNQAARARNRRNGV